MPLVTLIDFIFILFYLHLSCGCLPDEMKSSVSSDVAISCKVSLHLQPTGPQQNLAGRKKQSHSVFVISLFLILNKKFCSFLSNAVFHSININNIIPS